MSLSIREVCIMVMSLTQSSTYIGGGGWRGSGNNVISFASRKTSDLVKWFA